MAYAGRSVLGLAGVAEELPESSSESYHIFLSHSGKQKRFVEELDGDLKRAHHTTFFDQDNDSLPRAELFRDTLLSKAATCAIGVVVLSEEFLTSQWPLLELCCMCDHNRHLYPLFYKLSHTECKSQENRSRWMSNWDRLAGDTGGSINREKCRSSLDKLLEYGGGTLSKSEAEFRKKIVSTICLRRPPRAIFDEAHVKGKDRFRKELITMFEDAKRICKRAPGACVVSLHGEGGSGKTTICKTMVNFYCAEYCGKSFLLELPLNGDERLVVEGCKLALRVLTEASNEPLERCSHLDQVISLMKERLKLYKVFLAIDNISDRTREIVGRILDSSFCPGTKVLTTSRSSALLEVMLLERGCDKTVCHHIVPSMDQEDGKSALLHYAAHAKLGDKLDRLVELARFDNRFHPLALKSVALRLQNRGRDKNFDAYVEDLLERLRVGKTEEGILSVLKTSYDELNDRQKVVFLDVAVVRRFVCLERGYSRYWTDEPGLINVESLEDISYWLSSFHDRSCFELQEDVHRLEREGLLNFQRKHQGGLIVGNEEDVDETIQIHDLYIELAESEVKKDPRFFCPIDGGQGLQDPAWAKLERIVWRDEDWRAGRSGIVDMILLNASKCSKVRLLILNGNTSSKVIKLQGMTLLRFVQIGYLGVEGLSVGMKITWLNLYCCEADGFEDMIGGFTKLQVLMLSDILGGGLADLDLRRLKQLKALASNRGSRRVILGCHIDLEQLCLEVRGEKGICSCDILPNLKVLFLWNFEILTEQLTSTSRRRLSDGTITSRVNILSGLELENASNFTDLPAQLEYLAKPDELDVNFGKFCNLHSLLIQQCKDLVEISTLHYLTNLHSLYVSDCGNLKTIWLKNLVNLRALYAVDCPFLVELPGLGDLAKLETLDVRRCVTLTSISLKGLIKLRCLRARGCYSVVDFPHLDGLISLKELSLSNCRSLEVIKLPQLAKVTTLSMDGCTGLVQHVNLQDLSNLVVLNFYGCPGPVYCFPFCVPSKLRCLWWQYCCCGKEHGCLSEEILSCLSSLTKLETLELTGCSCVASIPDLATSAQLSRLDICAFPSLGRLPTKALTALTELSLSYVDVELDTAFMGPNLRILKLRSLRSSLRIFDLRKIAELAVVEIAACNSVKSIDLRDLAKLGDVTIQCAESLEILQLENLGSLRRVTIDCAESLEILQLENLDNLDTLKIRGCGSLGNLNLRDFASLQDLEVVCCERLEKVALKCKRLRTVKVGMCASLINIYGTCDLSSPIDARVVSRDRKWLIFKCKSLAKLDLSGLPYPQELRVHECISLAHIHLSQLTSLQNVELKGCNSSAAIRYIQCEALRNFTIGGCFTTLKAQDWTDSPASTDWPNVERGLSEESLPCTVKMWGNLTNLKTLMIEGTRSCSVLDLGNLRKLEGLIVANCEKLTELLNISCLSLLKYFSLGKCELLQGLPSLPASLKEMDLSYLNSLGMILDLSALNQLQSITMTMCEAVAELALSSYASVRRVHLRDLCSLKRISTSSKSKTCMSSSQNILDLSSFSKLESIVMRRCDAVAELALPPVASVKELCLRDLCFLERISNFSTLSELERVMICDCEALNELPDFSSMSSLKLLCMSGTQPSLVHLSGLVNLRMLAVASKTAEIKGLDYHRKLSVLAVADERLLRGTTAELNQRLPELKHLLIRDWSGVNANVKVFRMGWCSLDVLAQRTVCVLREDPSPASMATMEELIRHWFWRLMQGDEGLVVVRERLLNSIKEARSGWISFGRQHFFPVFLRIDDDFKRVGCAVGCLFCLCWQEGEPVVMPDDDFQGMVVEAVTHVLDRLLSAGITYYMGEDYGMVMGRIVTWAVGALAGVAREGGERFWRVLGAMETVGKLIKLVLKLECMEKGSIPITLPAFCHFVAKQPKFALQLRNYGASAWLRRLLSTDLGSCPFMNMESLVYEFGRGLSDDLYKLLRSMSTMPMFLDRKSFQFFYDQWLFGDCLMNDFLEVLKAMTNMPFDWKQWWATTLQCLGDHAQPSFISNVERQLESLHDV